MNIELLKQVRDAVADEANAFDMDAWGVGLSKRGLWWFAIYDSDQEIYEMADANACGTAACLAGWAIRLGRPQKKSVVNGRPSIHNPGDYAGRILGIEDGAWGQRKGFGSHSLFHTRNWPDWARNAIDDCFSDTSERDVALVMLDLIIAGENPWDRPEGWVMP